MKIYTRKGDRGETSLLGGARISKGAPRVEAYGGVDELNCALGLVRAGLPDQFAEWSDGLREIQSDCFVIGAILAVPPSGSTRDDQVPVLAGERVSRLEGWIDELDRELKPLNTFVLPGGTPTAAAIHLARAICRRAERAVVALAAAEAVEPLIVMYLNRLSDLLFTLARAANSRAGVGDEEWHAESG